MSYYAVLGVPPDADAAEIRRAFRSLARRYHPDAGAGASPERFRQVVEAYETLSDPARRTAYDESLARPVRRWTPVEPMVEPMVNPATAFRHRPDPLQTLFDDLLSSFFTFGPRFFR